MPTTTIYSHSGDGWGYSIDTSGSWDTARDTCDAVSTTSTSFQRGVSMYVSSGRGGGTYLFRRSFFLFDTSVITGAVTSATLNLKNVSSTVNNQDDIICVKSGAFGGDGSAGLVVADWTDYPGYSSGATMEGAVTDYSAAVDWDAVSTNTYEVITLTSSARTDIQNDNVLIIMVVDYNYDYKDVVPGGDQFVDNGWYFADQSGVSSDPYISVVWSASGYGNIVNGVAAASIGKVDGVATANIEKVIGV